MINDFIVMLLFCNNLLNVGVCSLIIDGWFGARRMGGWMGTVAKLVKNCQKITYVYLQYYRVPDQWVHKLSQDALSRDAII